MPPQISRRSSRSKSDSIYPCPQCDKTYERPDHLVRHLDSHQNKRHFQCNVCQRGFNRRDVLQRHETIHSAGKIVKRQKERAVEACEECAAVKLSCDNDRPCQRCRRKGALCTPRTSKSAHTVYTPVSDPYSVSQNHDTPGYLHEYPGMEIPQSSLADSAGTQHFDTGPEYHLSPLPDDTLLDYQGMSEFPAFFEHVMLPESGDITESSGIEPPRAVFDFMNDTEFTLFESDLFASDIMPDLDHILTTEFPSPFRDDVPVSSAEETTERQRVAAFRKSLWLWEPQKNQNAFSDEGSLPLGESDMTTAISSSHRTPLEGLHIRGKLSDQASNDIFQLVVKTAGSQISIPSFPTADSLDTLIKIGISKRTETDAWIHPYTFYQLPCRPELLTAMVAAGCVCCGLPSIGKTGVLLLEIVRVSLAHLVEADNSVLRDLHYLQASMIWLDIGIFCGYKQKMQMAESYFQPLCTALRRAGAFDRSSYVTTSLAGVDGDESLLEGIWHAWVRQESLKRLAYHLYEHDIETAAAMNRPALTSYAEFTLPFPSSRDLWLAPTASAWRSIWMRKYEHSAASGLCLRDLLSDPSILHHLPPDVDSGVARSACLHGIGSQVWEFRQQALLSEGCRSESRAMARLWLQSRQDDLYLTLQTAQHDMPDAPAVATLMNEFFMMHLHLNFDSMQRFAGQLGELEARREYPRLLAWCSTKAARTAISHAGQALRAARRVPPFRLRGFDSLAIYHSTLTLWVFGLLQCGRQQGVDVTDASVSVSLDGARSECTKAFVDRGIGMPGLTMQSPQGHNTEPVYSFCPLRSPRLVMEVARQVYEGNCPGAADNLPPLVNNLRNLIRDLGNLP